MNRISQRWQCSRRRVLLLILLLLATSNVVAQMISTHYRIPSSVLDNGGNCSSSDDLQIWDSIGQSTPIGISNSPYHCLYQGFQATAMDSFVKCEDCDPPNLIKPTDFHGMPGDTVVTKLVIDNNLNPIDVFFLELHFDPDMLTFESCVSVDLTEGWIQLLCSKISLGVINIGGFDPVLVIEPGSTGSIAEVIFTVTDCEDGECTAVCTQNLKDDLTGWSAPCCGMFCCPCERGDVNCDGEITPGDALCTFWRSIEGEWRSECECECSEKAADVNCDADITPGDALCIFWRSIEEDWRPECQCLHLTKPSEQTRKQFAVSVGEVVGNPGGLVRIPILVDNPEDLSAFGASLTYPADFLDFVEVTKTTATQDWIALNGSDNGLNEVTLGGFHIESISTAELSAVAEVIFRIREDANGEGNLTLTRLLDDFNGAITTKGYFSTSEEVPITYALYQNYPNPFNPTTDIRYQISECRSPIHTTLKIYNILGQEVRTLVDKAQKPGYYSVTWDGRDNLGHEVSSGIYFYRLKAGEFTATKRMVLIR